MGQHRIQVVQSRRRRRRAAGSGADGTVTRYQGLVQTPEDTTAVCEEMRPARERAALYNSRPAIRSSNGRVPEDTDMAVPIANRPTRCRRQPRRFDDFDVAIPGQNRPTVQNDDVQAIPVRDRPAVPISYDQSFSEVDPEMAVPLSLIHI